MWLDFLAAGRLWRLFLPAGVPCRACFVVDDGRCSGVFAVGIWWVCLGSRDLMLEALVLEENEWGCRM